MIMFSRRQLLKLSLSPFIPNFFSKRKLKWRWINDVYILSKNNIDVGYIYRQNKNIYYGAFMGKIYSRFLSENLNEIKIFLENNI